MIKAIGFLELNSIAMGIEAADEMLKTADVELYFSSPTCPGKYISLVYGNISAVERAIEIGIKTGGSYVIDDMIIANVEERIFPAITGTNDISEIRAIGVIESFSIASLILVADSCAKAANIDFVEVRLGSGIGGKSYVILTGDVSDVKSAVDVGCASMKESGNLVYSTVIPAPHKNLKTSLL